MSNVKIVNVVATGYLGQELDLKYLATKMINIIYNPEKFTAAILCLRNPKTTFLLFKSGRFVSTGAKSIECAKKSSRIIARKIQLLHEKPIRFLDFTIQNVVGTFFTPFKLNLETFYYSNISNSLYEPEFFPGLKYLPSKSEKKTVLIFISGKIVLTGFKNEKDVYDIASYLYRLFLKFKRE